ncbi:MAG: hypothetical protein HKO59_03410, partial [Phycisphaerales bacterium]|nr:hypothetical protein [Phycisphaerales bacterium]
MTTSLNATNGTPAHRVCGLLLIGLATVALAGCGTFEGLRRTGATPARTTRTAERTPAATGPSGVVYREDRA